MDWDLTDPVVDPNVAVDWIIALVVAFLLLVVIARIIESFDPEGQQWTVTGIAVTNGLIISIGVSPFGEFATEMARLFEMVPSEYPEIVGAFLTLETAFTLLYGLGVMWESGKHWAVVSFVTGIFGGMLIPYSPVFAFIVIGFASLAMIASPAKRW